MPLTRFAAVAAALLALSISYGSALAAPEGAETVPLTIKARGGEHSFEVELADEPAERSRGLMYRRQMAEDAGMLFDFGEVRDVSMWMKNTYLPLDMLFIEPDGEILSIARRTTPLSEATIPSGGPILYVLEINGGLARKLGIEPGDMVTSPAMAPR